MREPVFLEEPLWPEDAPNPPTAEALLRELLEGVHVDRIANQGGQVRLRLSLDVSPALLDALAAYGAEVEDDEIEGAAFAGGAS